MIGKTVTTGLVGLLIVALIGGSAYILLRPNDGLAAENGPGYTRVAGTARAQSNGYQGGTQRQDQDAAGQRTPGLSAGNPTGRGQARQGGRSTSGEPLADNPRQTWTTLNGTVSAVDGDNVTIQTAEGSRDVHLGPEWYWETEGIDLAPGDEVAITGLDEKDTFDIASVENHTNGQAVTLRDESGRPLWAGRGNGRQGGEQQN